MVVSPHRGGRLRWFGWVKDGTRTNWIRPLQAQSAGAPGELIGGCGLVLARPGDVAVDAAPSVPEPGSMDEPWQLTERTDDSIMLMHHHRGPSPGSWSYQVSQTLRLQQQRLEWSQSIRNLGRLPLLTRLGWQLHLPDEFCHQICLDAAVPVLRRPPRGHVERCTEWDGVATFGGTDGRFVLLRAPGPMRCVTMTRSAVNAAMRVDLLTADVPHLDPLQRGEERTLHLAIDLMHTRAPAAG
ncbi:MAG: hypothetical protein ABW220_11385 [Burkholderiaceae bacterium]